MGSHMRTSYIWTRSGAFLHLYHKQYRAADGATVLWHRMPAAPLAVDIEDFSPQRSAVIIIWTDT